MQVSDDTIKVWSDLYERNDNNKLAKILGIAPQNVSVIRKTGKGSLTQISCIQKFYKNRLKEVKKNNQPIDHE